MGPWLQLLAKLLLILELAWPGTGSPHPTSLCWLGARWPWARGTLPWASGSMAVHSAVWQKAGLPPASGHNSGPFDEQVHLKSESAITVM